MIVIIKKTKCKQYIGKLFNGMQKLHLSNDKCQIIIKNKNAQIIKKGKIRILMGILIKTFLPPNNKKELYGSSMAYNSSIKVPLATFENV